MGRAAHRGRFADQCARGLSSTAKTVSFNSGGLSAARPPKSRQRCLMVSSPHRHKHPRERPKRVLEPPRGGWKLPRPTELTTNSLFFGSVSEPPTCLNAPCNPPFSSFRQRLLRRNRTTTSTRTTS